MTAHDQNHDKLWDFIEDISIAMLTTRDGDVLRSRPMFAQTDRDEGSLVFFVNAQDHKTDEVMTLADVNASFADRRDHVYVSCSGEADIVSDPGTIDKYWSSSVEPWYPDGRDDPNLRLLRIRVSQAEYWERDANSLQMMWEITKGAFTGEIPEVDNNRKINVA